jgi:signal transduction histidine kinase
MRDDLLRLAEDRVLREQLRLILGNMANALAPTLVLSCLMVWALSSHCEILKLLAWGLALMTLKTHVFFYARRHLTSDLTLTPPRRMVLTLMLLNALDGGLWGALAWIALSDGSSLPDAVLVIATAAGMVGSSVSRLSPVMPVFFSFTVTLLLLLAAKVWSLGDPSYQALGLVSVIFLTSLTLMARNSSREIRAAINLRFENIELLEQLRAKTVVAETAQREAEYANAAKSKFLAAASHDLRQPIHAQGLFLDVLSRTPLDAHQRELLAHTRTSSQASSEMLDALLDFSRIEAGVIDPQPRAVRLQPLLHKIEQELAAQADAKNIVYRSRETHLVAHCDPVLLELILRNLISNAIRYTSRGGVLVACRRRGSQAVLEVWDTGIGIAPEHHEDVFREFHQLGNPERDRRKGLGLGLAIARGLAFAMGIELSLASTPGRGSVFRLALPITQAPAGQAPEGWTHDAVRALHVRVLVIDDDEAVRAGMLPLLRDWGCECAAAESIEEAIELTRLRAPDLIISDYRLREQRTGVEAITTLRAVWGRAIPALLITGDTAPQRLREAQASGLPLLHKPVAPRQLYRKMVETLKLPA